MDEDLAIVVHLGGHWSEEVQYVDYEVRGITIPKETKYSNVRVMIYEKLSIDPTSMSVKIQFQMKAGYKPSDIFDENSWSFYLALKKRDQDILSYPLCVSTSELEPKRVYSIDISEISDEHIIHNEVIGDYDNDILSSDNQYHLHSIVKYSRKLVQSTMEELKTQRLDGESSLYGTTCNIISDRDHSTISVGQIYRDKETILFVLKQHALREHFQFRVVKPSPKKFNIKCISDSCKWMLKSKSIGETSLFEIKKYDCNHTCGPDIRFSENRQASTDVIAYMYKDKFESVKTPYTPAHIMHELRVKKGITVNYMKAYRGRKLALEKVRGKPEESFNLLPSYMHMLHTTNPGSVIDLQTDEENHFLYLFVALDVSIKGWKCCKPIIVVDGTFLTSKYLGTLITTSTQDVGNTLFVLAYAVVDLENNGSWVWFFKKFKETFGTRDEMIIVSDRAKSIENAAKQVYPEAEHCVCIYHLVNNLKCTFRRKSKNLREFFNGAAYAYTLEEFNRNMRELDKISKGIRTYLNDIGFKKWSRVHATFNRGDFMTSNAAECLNLAISAAKDLPITALIDYLRGVIQGWTYENRQLTIMTVSTLTQPYQEKLIRQTLEALYMQVKPSSTDVAEAIDNCKRFIVHLEQKRCTCNRFQLDEFPCPHALAVLKTRNKQAYEYYSPFYTNKMKLLAYARVVEPIQDKEDWSIPAMLGEQIVLPPIVKAKPGRPRKRRLKAAWETNKTKYHCGNCRIK